MGSSPENVEEPHEGLRSLVVDVLERIEEEGPDALEAACREHPDVADRLRRRIASLRELGFVGPSLGEPPERVGEFRLVEKIGVGGMGVVYRAVQESLGREVALKLIRPDALHQAETRERFARETAIIASLQHPGIVPIYTVGDDEALPWYAMEHVPGCTLAEALLDLRGTPVAELTGADLRLSVSRVTGAPVPATESPLFAGSWEATCLRVLRQVADALDHAHARGVLHRDIKPSNVMITPEGRVMLVDFGLSSSEGADDLTRTGERVGSLPYMPPELLRDGPQALDRTSDLYALGVTLYEMLTLRTPFPGESVPARMAKILEGRPALVRSHAPGISWEAETVCLAAMDCDPRRRYATAGDLGRDLDNALERRPVEARRASALLLLRRFVQRRPGAAAAILLAVLLPTVVAALLARESRNVSAALRVAEDEREIAEDNFLRGVKAIEAMLHNLGGEALDDVPGMDGVRHAVLDDAAELYLELLAERPDHLELAKLAAECEVLRAELDTRANRSPESEAGLRRALAWLEPWAEDGPHAVRATRANVLIHLAASVGAAHRTDEARVFDDEVLALYRDLLAERPGDPDVAGILINVLGRRIFGDRTQGAREAPPPELDELERIGRSLLASGDSRALEPLGRALDYRAGWASFEGDHETAVALFEEAFDLHERAAEALPHDDGARYRFATIAGALAGARARIRDAAGALEASLVAAREIERLLADFPDVLRFQERAATIQLNLGVSLSMMRRVEEARASLERAAELHIAVLEAAPDRTYLHRSLGTLYLNLATVRGKQGDAAGALDTIARAREHLEAACASFPDDADNRSWLALERHARAGALLALARPAEAAEALVGVDLLAAHRTDRLGMCLDKLSQCLAAARGTGDDVAIGRSETATREVIAGTLARGDMASNPTLLALMRELDVE